MQPSVIDPFGAVHDTSMPLAQALDPDDARRRLRVALSLRVGEGGGIRLRAIRVTRHKPGRRCVVEYELKIDSHGSPPEKLTLVGKVRAGRSGASDYRLLRTIWAAGFEHTSSDGICVPEPIATVPKWRMWLQRKVRGRTASALLAEPSGIGLVQRIAQAAHKLHQAGVPTARRHTMADELRVLRQCLGAVATSEPQWASGVERVWAGCERLGRAAPVTRPRGIHRDFYADQVIVHKGRVCLLDFDLYCLGDPALDVGNFLGHVTEQSLRTLGDATALGDREQAMEERFVELTGESVRPAVRAYATLTLARHIFLSLRLPDRRHVTERLIELCEDRLGACVAPSRSFVATRCTVP